MIALPYRSAVLAVRMPDFRAIPVTTFAALDFAREYMKSTVAIFIRLFYLNHIEDHRVNNSHIIILNIILWDFAFIKFLFLS